MGKSLDNQETTSSSCFRFQFGDAGIKGETRKKKCRQQRRRGKKQQQNTFKLNTYALPLIVRKRDLHIAFRPNGVFPQEVLGSSSEQSRRDALLYFWGRYPKSVTVGVAEGGREVDAKLGSAISRRRRQSVEKEGDSGFLGIEEEKGVGWLVIPRRLITSPSRRRPRKSDDEDRKRGGRYIATSSRKRERERGGGKKMPPLRLPSSVAIIRRRRRCLRDTRGRNVGDVSVHDTCGTFLPIHHTLRYCPPALEASCVFD